MLKFNEVKVGGWVGLKTLNNTQGGNNFNVVVWWSIDGKGEAPSNISSQEFREVKATSKNTPEELANIVANSINNKGETVFNISNINDNNYDYYIRY